MSEGCPDALRSEVTPKEIYVNRRRFLAAATGGLLLTATDARAEKLENLKKSPLSTTGEQITPYKDVTSYNNFFEFGTGKADPARNAGKLKTQPWKVSVEGQCSKPKTYDLDSLMKFAPLEERVYRHRCVEGWSIVVPWIGYSLSAVLTAAEPNAKAKYVAFESYYDRGTMLSPEAAGLEFPYREGLRLDEAMHPLTLLCFGMYGETLPKQDGAPVRMVHSLEIRLQEHQVDRQNPAGGKGAANHLERGEPARVRLLFERQPGGRSPALEPGKRAAARRILQAQDAEVQRIRRPGGVALQRHGSEEVLLTMRGAEEPLGESSRLPALPSAGRTARGQGTAK